MDFSRHNNGIFFSRQVNYLISPNRASILVTIDKDKRELQKKKQPLNAFEVKARQCISREETPHLVISMGSRSQAVFFSFALKVYK